MGTRSATRRSTPRVWPTGHGLRVGDLLPRAEKKIPERFGGGRVTSTFALELRWLGGRLGSMCHKRTRRERSRRFQTELWATEPHLKKLIRMWPAREAAATHLKRCLAQLGRMVSGDDSRVRIGSADAIGQSLIPSEQPRCFAHASESPRFGEAL